MNIQVHQPALATLAQFYEAETAYLASEARDFSEIAVTLDPECVIYQPASLPYGGEWRGHSGFEAWMKAFAQQWSSLEVKDAELYPNGDVIVSKSHVYAVAKTTGHAVDWPLLQFFRMRQKKIIELRPFYWDTAALLAALTH
ncbi:MAG TPA: nuclear transport factor 2 family protein [Acidisarcina sp.]|nr:nuclear transport factor 2 family protein [Acidisarcina sp.]